MQMEGNGFTCTLAFRNEVHMKAPIFVYYQLNNFFQNHRRYTQKSNETVKASHLWKWNAFELRG